MWQREDKYSQNMLITKEAARLASLPPVSFPSSPTPATEIPERLMLLLL